MELVTKRIKLAEILPNRVEEIADTYDLKADEAELVRKGATVDAPTVDEGERAAVQWVSTRHVDRDGEIVMPSGWDLSEFEKTGRSVMWGHDYSKPPIGKDLWIKKDPKMNPKGLLAKTVYAETPFASEVFTLKQGGFLNTSSVGFIPIEHVESGTEEYHKLIEKLAGKWPEFAEKADSVRRIYTKALLLEHSDVSVPSNPDALMIAVSKGLIVSPELAKELEIVTKPEPDITENYIRLRQRDPGDFVQDSFRTITLSASEGIKAIIGKLTSDPQGSTVVQSYLFVKDKWTVERAQAWVRDHEKEISVNGETVIWRIPAALTIKSAQPESEPLPDPEPTIAKRVIMAVQGLSAEEMGEVIAKQLREILGDEIDRARGKV